MAEKDPSQRVVITGMGMVSPLGLDVKSSWRALINGEVGIRDVRGTRLDGYTEDSVKASLGAPVMGFELLDNPAFDKPDVRKDRKKWHLTAEFVLQAGFEALNQAGLLTPGELRVSEEDSDMFGVSVGTGIGGALDAISDVSDIIKGYSQKSVRPTAILHALPNRPSEVASIVFGAEAFADSVFAECATGLANIRRAAQEIKEGSANVVLAGGVEAGVVPISLAMFGATGAVNLGKDPLVASRPLNKDAGGLVMGEGAGVVVVESLEHARARNATILAELVGYGKSADAYKDTKPSGVGAIKAIRRALANAGLKPSDLGTFYDHMHATSTDEDYQEMRAVSEVFDRSQGYANSTKGATGHTLGAAGGIETIFGVKALETDTIPPAMKLDDPIDEAEGWRTSPNEATEVDGGLDTVIKESFGFGGINEVLILQKY
jgi:3-oxoacyl-[acyl-carrier-protein] synthase II